MTIFPRAQPNLDRLLEEIQVPPFDQLAELLTRRDRDLATYHTCGELLASLRPEKAGYGAGWVKEVCEKLARKNVTLSLSLAYRLLRFAELFPSPQGRTQIRPLVGKVSWEIMMRVLHVEDGDMRNAILQRAADEKLSSRDVIALIREKVGYRRARGGRPKSKPSSHPNRALKDLRVLASKWQAVCESWSGEGNSALKRTAKLSAAKVTDAFLEDMKSTASLVEQMSLTAGPLAKELSALYVALSKKRNKQK